MDLRPPVYDVRELQAIEAAENGTNGQNSLEKERNLASEDPKWQDTNYVLATYKTEPCKRPPRLCRQGYACPQYHNGRDRRRSPRKFKYRSTPCPNVKHGDEWGEPTNCESGDNCPYCHSRTEQQFHPEIYKSTKCNDMQQNGYCPRGPFCAFAHVDQEMTTTRDIGTDNNNSLAAILSNALPNNKSNSTSVLTEQGLSQPSLGSPSYVTNDSQTFQNCLSSPVSNQRISKKYSSSSSPQFSTNSGLADVFSSQPLPTPIGKPRSHSSSSSLTSDSQNHYQKAPGSEREDREANIRKQFLAIDNDSTLGPLEKAKKKQNLYLIHNLNPGSVSSTPPTPSSTVSPLAPPFYPASDTVESVVGNALDDLSLDEINVAASIDKDLDNDSNSVSSSISAGLASSGMLVPSQPISVPSNNVNHSNSLNHIGASSSSPLNSFMPSHLPQRQEQSLDQTAIAFLSHPNTSGKFSSFTTSSSLYDYSSQNLSPSNRNSFLSSSFTNNTSEVQRLREELATNKAKLLSWEEGIQQARNACDAWRRETEEANRKTKLAEQQRDEALNKVSCLQKEVEMLRGGPFLHILQRVSELETLPLSQLKQLQQQLRTDLDKLDMVVYHHTTMKCMTCQERNRSVAVMPCNHYVLCEKCAPTLKECPYCQEQIAQRSSIVLPL